MKNIIILLVIGIGLGIVPFLLSFSIPLLVEMMFISFLIVFIAVYSLSCKYNSYCILLCLPIAFIYFFIVDNYTNKVRKANYNGDFKVVASVTCGDIHNGRYRVSVVFFNNGLNITSISKNVTKSRYNSIQDFKTIIIKRGFDGVEIDKWNPTSFEILKFLKPVYYRGKEEIGNDYYYYAKIQSDISLKNFGLRRVAKLIENSDTILYYKNLNDSIDSQTYRCVDSLQTQANRNKVGDSFGFLFHDGIYSKEQVFEEIPQAKEYYLKYCKEEQNINEINNEN